MIFDTDVLVWLLRGNGKAAQLVDKTDARQLSVVTYMELLQGARDRRELKIIKSFLADLGFGMLPLTENIGHRASIYMEEYCLSGGMSMADALLAATAVEHRLVLCTCNEKHYKVVKELDLSVFRP